MYTNENLLLDDLKQYVTVIVTVAYKTAQCEEKLSRKKLPKPTWKNAGRIF